jgi:hypothetical protein
MARKYAAFIFGLAATVFANHSCAAGSTNIPDFSGLWARQSFGFEPPQSGNGPILRMEKLAKGPAEAVGDYTNPILKPEAAEIIRHKGEIILSGVGFPQPSNQCAPYPPPFIFAINQELELAQKKDEVVILHMFDNQTRRVRLGGTHPAKVTPSRYGDSVGHYEGDTLVVDTISVKVTPIGSMDRYGTPYSDALHLTERWRLVGYDTAKASQEQSERINGLVPGDSGTGDGIGIDANYKGRGLQVEFTVEDPTYFSAPGSAKVTYRRAAGGWVERICAENPHVYYDKDTKVPEAAKPDF